MTTGRLGTHALPQMLFLPLFAAGLLLLANGCYAEKLATETEETYFKIVATYLDNEREVRENDVILTDRELDESNAGSDEGLLRGVRQANTQNEVELLLVLDRTGFERFLTSNNNNETAAKEEVARYFAGVIKAVNARLQNADTGGFSVRVILLEILVLIGSQSAVTDDLDQDRDGNIDADVTLSRFMTLSNTIDVLTPHDLALLVTGYNLTRANGVDPVGISFQNGVCSSNKQGIMEERGSELLSLSAAHQIGHALGARHDQLQNACPDASFTMSATASVPSLRSQSGNPFTYSQCSVSEIRTFLASQFTDCLRSRQTTPGSELDIAALTTVPLGQQYDADQQCRSSYGATSKFCRGEYNNANFAFDGDMCYDMRCLSSQGTCVGALPFNGTSCGNRKWCEEGSCVTNLEAPAAPSDTCPQGDDPTATCTQSSCAVEQLRLFECCATCASSVVPTGGPVSVAGAQTTIQPPTPPGGATLSIFGVTSGPGPNPATMSIDGVQPGTTNVPTMSIFGVQPQTPTPSPGATMSIFGVAPVVPTLSIDGIQPGTTSGPTMSIFGVQPGPTPGPAGPTLSVAGPAAPTPAGISVAPPATPGPPTMSVPGPGVVIGI